MSEMSIRYIVPLRILSGKRIQSNRHLDNQVKTPLALEGHTLQYTNMHTE